MDKKRWDIVIPIITIFLLLFAIILVLIKNGIDESTKEVVTTEATTEAEIATASVATPDEALSEQIEPEPTIEVVHYKSTTESTTQATTTEEVVTEVFSATMTTEEYTEAVTEEYTEEITEEWTEEPTTEEYFEEPLPPEEPQEPEPPAEPTAPEGMTSIGSFYITGYTATGNATSSGVMPEVGVTAACNSLPAGTVIYIEGIGTRVIQDTGAMSNSVIDVFVGSTSEAYAITGTYEVYIVE